MLAAPGQIRNGKELADRLQINFKLGLTPGDTQDVRGETVAGNSGSLREAPCGIAVILNAVGSSLVRLSPS